MYKMDYSAFFKAYNNGQRHFVDLDFEDVEGFSNQDFSNIIFENCLLYADFSHSNLTNAKFIGCNIKVIDLSYCNLTNAFMTECSVEGTFFKNAIIEGFTFIENYCYGVTIGQKEFDEIIYPQQKIM